MDALHEYKIGFNGLAIGNHYFSFEVRQPFFDCFEQSEIGESDVHLDLSLEKDVNMLVFDFAFTGWVMLNCDRCLDQYKQYVDQEQRIIVKFGDEYREQSEDIVIIPFGDTHFDVSQYIFEYLHLALPIQRAHPINKEGKSECDQEMLENVRKLGAEHSKSGLADHADSSTWDVLKSLKFDNKKDN